MQHKTLKNASLIAVTLIFAGTTAACSRFFLKSTGVVSVLPTGIEINDPTTKKVTEFSFGEPEANVSAALTTALGNSTGIVGETACGLTINDWPGRFRTVERDDTFVGWIVDGYDRKKSDFRAPDGRGTGSTLTELQAISPTKSRIEGDHNEFNTSDGYAGALNGNVPEAVVYIFTGGESCEDPNYPWPQPYESRVDP